VKNCLFAYSIILFVLYAVYVFTYLYAVYVIIKFFLIYLYTIYTFPYFFKFVADF